jgi:prepilin-type N-terminal cleavage/methylation domain-containing protein
MRRLPTVVYSGSRGFTLLELLVVMGILTLLTSMLMPVIGLAQRQSRATASWAMMGKVDVALRRLRADIRSFPCQRSYADWPLRRWGYAGVPTTGRTAPILFSRHGSGPMTLVPA